MANITLAFRDRAAAERTSADAVLNAIPSVVVVIAADASVAYLNAEGEQFFQGSAAYLEGRAFEDLAGVDGPLSALSRQAQDGGTPVSAYGVVLDCPRIGRRTVDAHAAPIAETPQSVVLAIQERHLAGTIEHRRLQSGAARSVTAMAAMLAHEVKNPLSGIRGAAQLLEAGATAEDRPLTALIRDETDRITALVERMEVFSETGTRERRAVNIHEVLDRVHRLARGGFARHAHFVEDYDPSLPPVPCDPDQMVQVFLNLVKNAAEAVPRDGGRIVLATAYRREVRLSDPGAGPRVRLPLVVSVEDNGGGIPKAIQSRLFEPFVTSKERGTGLGLAICAKIVDDHAGVMEFDSAPGATIFRVMLPVCDQTNSVPRESE
jgi:two-component system nitrogen regulation sensor histidine kinase GlnL